ncbi:MAG: hypothetical protein IT487_05875 [Chromatiaceae bacterium]|nr:hypothetical protein [Chromatiaceae bacterium]
MSQGRLLKANGAEVGPGAKGAPGLHQFWLSSVFALAPLMLVAYLIGLYIWVERENEFAAMQARNYSELVAQELGKHAARVQDQLRAWARDPALRQALRQGDAQALATEEQRLAGRIPLAMRVRLVPLRRHGEANGEPQDLSLAGLDLVHRAQQERATTPLEAHLVGQDGMHLAIAAPVLDENKEGVLGVIHVALPMALLPFLQDEGPKWGQLQFQQEVEIEVATLDLQSHSSAPNEAPSFWVNVPGTSLRVAAWMTPESLLAPKSLLIALGGFLLTMSLIAFVLRLLLNRLERALAADFASLRAMIEDAANTWPIRKLHCRLAETQPLVEAIRPLLIGLAAVRRRTQGEPHAGPAPVAPGAPVVGVETVDLELGEVPPLLADNPAPPSP